ncbi:LysM peptidoglycan-binding domain-containing protein [Winogradskyella sp. PC D3.3]
MSICAQDEVKFKNVILDGKPARLNILTGEISLVQLEDKTVETPRDSVETTLILETNRSVINVSIPTNLEADNDSDFHMVKEGDNLFKLSVKYKTTLGELKKANNLETTLITAGQKLRVRNFDNMSEKEHTLVWVVKKGDNLYRIAKENGTTVKALKDINGLKSDVIKIGQKVQLK